PDGPGHAEEAVGGQDRLVDRDPRPAPGAEEDGTRVGRRGGVEDLGRRPAGLESRGEAEKAAEAGVLGEQGRVPLEAQGERIARGQGAEGHHGGEGGRAEAADHRPGPGGREGECQEPDQQAADQEHQVATHRVPSPEVAHGQVVRTERYFSKSSRIRPVPRTTQLSGSSSTCTGRPVSWTRSWSSPRISAPPPVITIPRSTMSLASSGGVISSARRTASTICCTGSCTASRISLECTRTVFGMPETRSRPFTSMSRSSPLGYALPTLILICSAVGSPMSRL